MGRCDGIIKNMKTICFVNRVVVLISIFPAFLWGAGVTHDFVEVRRSSGLPYIDMTRHASTDYHVRVGLGTTTQLYLRGPGSTQIKVGINTTTPDYPLDVWGTIRAKEVIVESNWSDYVFDADYELLPLTDVSKFIKINGHLPGIPSADSIKLDGLKISEMQTLMMAKIEELTLHLIDLNEKVDALSKENKKLKSQLETSGEK